MRRLALTLGLFMAACASPAQVTTTTLVSADAATSLLVGERVSLDRMAAAQAHDGMDPLVPIALRHADGRTLNFQLGNHTEHDLIAQRPGGALAQVMGLFGEESPALYHADATDNNGAPFLCGAEGPVAIGVYEAPDGGVQIVGLKQEFEFETRPDGVTQPLPFSPDQVCARLRFRRG